MSEERLILFADLLGFKALVRSTPLADVVARYHRVFDALWSSASRLRHRALLVTSDFGKPSAAPALAAAQQAGPNETLAAIHADTGFHTVVISDSFVVYSAPLEADDVRFLACLESLTLFARILLLRLFEARLPARAAITYGPLHADRDAGVYVGEGLVDAYELAESQEWIGGCVSPPLEPSLCRLLENHAMDNIAGLRAEWDVLRYDVPFKGGNRAAFAVNWVTAWNHGGLVRPDFFSPVMTSDQRVDCKYDNTLAFMQHVSKRWLGRPT